jgi:hypothetical protein
MAPLGVVILVSCMVALWRVAIVFHEIGDNDRQVRDRDEILRIWFEDYAITRGHEARERKLGQCRERLREAELLILEARRSERASHRAARLLLRRPPAGLTVPIDMIRPVEQWEIVAREALSEAA